MSPALRLVLPALAAAGSAYAACSAQATTTIQNGGDASALASCSTFSGSIAIATGTTEDIILDGVQEIDGNLVAAENDQIARISGADLENIKGSLTLDQLTRLSNINFPKLTTVESIKWNALPNLRDLQLQAQITKADTLDIQNTELQSLDGLNLESVKSVFIANNKGINRIDMQVGNVTESLTLADNNDKVNITFPNLMWAFNLTFRSCGSVSLPSLETLNGSLGLYNNLVEGFAAPNLTEVGEALALVGNKNMANISFPKLESVGGNLQIANNTDLKELDGFPELKDITGALDLSGNMTKVEIPKLNLVKGTFNLQSTGDIDGACENFFQPLHDDEKLKGEFFCKGSVTDPGTAGTSPSDAKPTGAASTLNAQNWGLGLASLAAVFLL